MKNNVEPKQPADAGASVSPWLVLLLAVACGLIAGTSITLSRLRD
jgi:hypothetical protein